MKKIILIMVGCSFCIYYFSIICKQDDNLELTKRYDLFGIWLPGMNPVFLNESKKGDIFVIYINNKVKRIKRMIGTQLEREWLVEYDKKERIKSVNIRIQRVTEDKYDTINYVVSKYDQNGRATKVNGTVITKFIKADFILDYIYYNEGYLKYYKYYRKDNLVDWEEHFIYDKKGSIISYNIIDGLSRKSRIYELKNTLDLAVHTESLSVMGYDAEIGRAIEKSLK